MATTVQNAGQVPTFEAILGKDANGDYYEVDEDSFCYIGTDGQSVANRVILLSDIGTAASNGTLPSCKPVSDYTNIGPNGEISLYAFPFMMTTDNALSGAVPTSSCKIYLDDDGKVTNSDSDSGLHSFGTCLLVDSNQDEPYLCNMTGPCMIDTDT